MAEFFAGLAWLPQGWARDVRLSVAGDGSLAAVRSGSDPAGCECLAGPAIPGLADVHARPELRALAGLAERGDAAALRRAVARLHDALRPEDLEAVAAQHAVEQLKAGVTAQGAFHPLHHDRDGRPYRDLPEMTWRVLSAAQRCGLGVTILPVLCGYDGFGGRLPGPELRRQLNEPERLLHLIQRVVRESAGDPQVRVGLGIAGLPAVTPESLQAAVDGLRRMDGAAPIHIPVAVDAAEVEACIDWSRRRPIEWLLDQRDLVDDRWCLLHAPAARPGEAERAARRGCVVGLCPGHAANRGAGPFPAGRLLARGGRLAVGGGAHPAGGPAAELRLLEYGQRVAQGRRPALVRTDQDAAPGLALLQAAWSGARRALGRPIGQLVPGARADFAVLETAAGPLAGVPEDRLLDAFVFAVGSGAVRDVVVGGRPAVRDGRHLQEDSILEAFRDAMARLNAA
jgi:formimidoylglutamate deiminase